MVDWVTSVAVLAQSRWPQGHMWGWGTGWMWVWMFVLLAVTVLLVGAVIWVLSRASRPSEGGRERARAILDERYARGELTTDEYRERLDALR